MLPVPQAWAASGVADMRDVSSEHWAAQAIQSLSEKYGVMSGFPDKSFQGARTVSRYELAAALAKLIATLERRIAIATGTPVPDAGIAPEDLRTIARLQREFREELDLVKERLDGLENRIGEVDKRLKVSGSVRVDYRDWLSDPRNTLSTLPDADFRVRQALDFEAKLPRDLAFQSTLMADLYAPPSAANAFLRGSTSRPVMDVYLSKALMRYNPGWADIHAGVGSLRQHLSYGHAKADPFKASVWSNGTGGFGFVGTPGLDLDTAGQPTLANAPGGAAVWQPGTETAIDFVDPNNSKLYGAQGDVLATTQFVSGPLRFGLGFTRGGLSGPLLQGGTTLTASSLPAFAQWDQPSRMVAAAAFDGGIARLHALTSAPNGTWLDPSARNRFAAAGFELGGEALALTGEWLAQGALSPTSWASHRAALRLGSSNLLDTGVGLHLGWLSGHLASLTPSLARPGLIEFTTRPNGPTQPDFQSLGLLVRTPAVLIIPSFTLALQQTGGGPDGLNGALQTPFASGLTLQTELALFDLPALQFEYSRGKFGLGSPQGLFSAAPFTHDQLALSTGLTF